METHALDAAVIGASIFIITYSRNVFSVTCDRIIAGLLRGRALGHFLAPDRQIRRANTVVRPLATANHVRVIARLCSGTSSAVAFITGCAGFLIIAVQSVRGVLADAVRTAVGRANIFVIANG